MDIRLLKDNAARQLETARDEKNIVMIYAGITVGLSALVTAINFLAGNSISQAGGLSNIGLRSILSTLQHVLPVVQSALLMVLELGYVNAALRISRGQYASAYSLKMGIDRFFPLVRCLLMQGLIYAAAGMAGFYLAIQVYLITPMSNAAMEILTPLVSDTTVLSNGILQLDGETTLLLAEAMIPLFILFAVIFLALCLPLMYWFRMANYVLIDKPQLGGWAILKESRKIMRRRCLQLLKLDLSFWWYWLLLVASGFLCYGDALLALAGVTLPWSGEVSFFLFYALFLAVTLVIYYFFRNKVEVTYALFYEQFKPVEQKDNSVVLGNIFQM